MKTVLYLISLYGIVLSIVGAVVYFFDFSFTDHRWSYEKVIILALISIASSGLYFIVHTEERSK